MLFNSISYIIFLPFVFIIYWLLKNNKLIIQNIILLIASYFFYASWNWRFVFLLIFSTLIDYLSGIKIYEAKLKYRKYWLYSSLFINIGILGVFKYYNFFSQSLINALSKLGYQINFTTLKIILPIGISFYTFHGISYIVDIYNKKIEPERNFINYALFVSFFPLLVAGPIERSTNLLPQIVKKRNFNYSKMIDGLRQILWGFFKKIVIADNCAQISNLIFNNYNNYSGSDLCLGVIFFSFQIYCDFSGYSDIAIGTAKLFGIELLRNFSYPYFSRDIAEFWRRWHISLSSWFKDYVYIPLGGSKVSTYKKIRNVFIIFLLSGLWHGSNWTYIAWGGLNAIYFMPLLLVNKNRLNLNIVSSGNKIPNYKDFFSILLTFVLVSFSWIFFRSISIKNALEYISKIFTKTLFSTPTVIQNREISYLILYILALIIIEWRGREFQHGLYINLLSSKQSIRWGLYYCILILIYLNIRTNQQFIYFQF